MFAISERAGLTRIMRGSARDIRFGLVGTFLATHPFGTLSLIIMSVAGEAIAVRAERDTVLVKAALETGLRLVIVFGVAHADGAEGVQVVIDKLQDFFMTFACIAKQFANFERGEALVQILKTRDGEQVVIAIGWSTRTCERPDESEPIVNNVEGFGFVSEMMLSVRSGLIFFFFGSIGIDLAGLVGSGIIYVGCLRIAKGGKATMLKTGGSIASTAILACFAGRAGAVCGGQGTGMNLVTTLHVRTG